MNIALCYENVLPARGGCETYIADLSRRLVADGHEVHLYACRWDADALPKEMQYHLLPQPAGPRFLRPWRFSAACQAALRANSHHVSIGFDKSCGQDILYPQGGLHAASADHNIGKYRQGWARTAARIIKKLDLAHWSFMRLEKKQYFWASRGDTRPLIVVNSHMVARHFQQYYNVDQNFLAKRLRVIHSAIDPTRFAHADCLKRRQEWRQQWKIGSDETVGLFVAMNYRLKGLEPLLRAVSCLPAGSPFRLLVAGHPRFQAYASLADKLGIANRVMFLGPRRDVHDSYYAADFLVHPTFYDPCSLVVLEALACGLPVITTRFNGASESLLPGVRPSGSLPGFVLDDPHDYQKLASFMIQFFDPDRRAACAEAARQTAAAWTFEHHYQRLMEVFTEATALKHAA
jgi:UDP-glucose:(heptosyl)LPS alpha-1,3-glucosyltransferase